MRLIAKDDSFFKTHYQLVDFPKPNLRMPDGLHDHAVSMLVSIEPCKRTNENLSSNFVEESFWKCLIADYDDGLMWKDFLQHFHTGCDFIPTSNTRTAITFFG